MITQEQLKECDDLLRNSESLDVKPGVIELPSDSDFTCCYCNKPMRYNIPRLGRGGGFIHTETNQFECGDKKEIIGFYMINTNIPMNIAISDSLKELDRKTEFLAQNISLSSSTCMGAQKHEKFAMLSFKADGHKYVGSDIEKVFDVFLDKEQLEYIVEVANKLLKE